MINIKNKLIELGVNLKELNQNFTMSSKTPNNVKLFLQEYKHSIFFNEEIIFSPKYKTNLEDEKGNLSLVLLWGLENGNFNIIEANDRLKNIDADKDLFSFGESDGDYHICISTLDNSIYLFANGMINPKYKLFNSYDEFFNSLHINTEEQTPLTGKYHAISIKLDL